MRRRFLLVHNPTAGRGGSRLTQAVVAELERRGASVVRAAPSDGSGAVLAEGAAEGFDAAVAAGGDGTFRALAAALGKVQVPIGLIPAGTGNVLANEIGLKRKASAVAEVLLNGPVVEIEAGRANGQPFYLMAGAGFDGDVIARLSGVWKKRVGKAAYTAPVLQALSLPIEPLKVTIDGQEHRAGWVVVSKAHRYGGPFTIAPEAMLTDKIFHVVLAGSLSKAVLVRNLLALGAGLIHRDPGVKIVRGSAVRIESERPVRVQVDGDEAGTTPLQIDHGGGTLSLIVPPSYRGRRR